MSLHKCTLNQANLLVCKLNELHVFIEANSARIRKALPLVLGHYKVLPPSQNKSYVWT